jgi:hypothetical protein
MVPLSCRSNLAGRYLYPVDNFIQRFSPLLVPSSQFPLFTCLPFSMFNYLISRFFLSLKVFNSLKILHFFYPVQSLIPRIKIHGTSFSHPKILPFLCPVNYLMQRASLSLFLCIAQIHAFPVPYPPFFSMANFSNTIILP